MGLHDRAWSGINILIFGKTSLLPMKIEQSIAAASPSNEIRIDSFEDYNDAYEFCKEKKNIGFFLILENCGKLPTNNVFQQLSNLYQINGWPSFGVLLYEKNETINGLRTLRNTQNLIDYRNVEDFLNPDRCATTLNEIWNQFISSFEKVIFPETLQKTFLSLIENDISIESFQFVDRISVLLTSNLNISWSELIAIKWNKVFILIENKFPKTIQIHQSMFNICNLAKFQKNEDILNYLNTKEPLCKRISALISRLEEERMAKNIEKFLQDIGKFAIPGSPAILRHLIANKEKVIDIANSLEIIENNISKKVKNG